MVTNPVVVLAGYAGTVLGQQHIHATEQGKLGQLTPQLTATQLQWFTNCYAKSVNYGVTLVRQVEF